jgi:hypothetical protein
LETTLTAKRKTTALPIVVAPVVHVRRGSRHNRALARENPQAFPEMSSSELLSDLEDPRLDEEKE